MADDDAEDTTARRRKLHVQKFIEIGQVEADLSWSDADLTGAMMKQASLFLHYGLRAAEAQHQVDKFKVALETAEAKVYRNLRDDAAAETPPRKVTEGQLEKDVAAHPAVLQVKLAINESRQIAETLKAAVEAFRQRKDMLVSVGLREREVMRGETYIAAKEGARTAGEERVMGDLRRSTKDKG